MGRMLRYLGLTLLAATAWLLIAELTGWVPEGWGDAWARAGAVGGAIALLAGILLGVLSPVGKELSRSRCVRCGAPVGRNESYCRDHLQEALNEIRDQTRDRLMAAPRGPRARPGSSSS